jgi:hypothetical protein
MTWITAVRPTPRPPSGGEARGLLRWVCTSNPFYVLSAGLFLAGLYASVEARVGDEQNWALMFGLIAYTLLLALTACLLVRLGGVWDDVRTVLLLIVLMFLATSVTFDGVLVESPSRGVAFYLVGLSFAVGLSEGILRVTGLRLPPLFRAPYHLFLALFFLYPLALSPFVDQPHGEELRWGLFGFSTAAGLVALTLLPAISRGADYVRDNGSPWRWPLFPWVLFGTLGFAVPARAFLLCWSMHLLTGRDSQQLIFGLYFLAPFGLAVAVLLLELALVTRRPGVLAAAMVVPVCLAALAVIDHRAEPVYLGFLNLFTSRLGGDPLSLAVLASAGFYAYASARGVPGAVDAVAAALVALAFIGPQTMSLWAPDVPRPLPILAAAAIQLVVGLQRRNAWRCLAGGCGAAAAALALPEDSFLREAVAFHLALVSVLLVGAGFDDAFGRFLRVAGGALAVLAGLAWAVAPPEGLPPGLASGYGLLLAVVLLAYGLLLRHRPSLAGAGLCLAVWLAAVGGRGYLALRQVVNGLDYIALSMVVFGVAVLISLGKAGALERWLSRRPGEDSHAEIPPTAIQKDAPLAVGAPTGQEIQQPAP